MGLFSQPVKQKPATRLAMIADTTMRLPMLSSSRAPEEPCDFGALSSQGARGMPGSAVSTIKSRQGFRADVEPERKNSRRMRSAGGPMDGVHDLGGMHGFGPVE